MSIKNIIIIIIVSILAYSWASEPKQSRLDNIIKPIKNVFVDEEKQPIITPNTSTNNTSITTSTNIEPSSNRDNRGFMEKVATNALSTFIATDAGQDLTARFLSRNSTYIYAGHAIEVTGYNPFFTLLGLRIDTHGKGNNPVCGQKIRVEYNLFDNEQKNITHTQEEYILGQHKERMMNAIPLFMQPGQIASSSDEKFLEFFKKTYSDKTTMVRVLLHSNSDIDVKPIANHEHIRMFDSHIFCDWPVVCGSTIQFDIILYKLDSKKIATHHIIHKIGNTHILDYLLLKKPLIGTRTVILQGRHAKEIIAADPLVQQLNDDEMLLLEINNTTLVNNGQKR